ncbi:37S ribosomal protein, mitochondrial [Lachnellula willkommii]|uniref:37S ribosomal protein, mitochondrial n=1 Tax=Lachnellula willkommii TaxID=215461 RepID=A0A559M3Z0_9HELO|nr:37S ribosomal protein, mitochondrial [Lachnellula willkommii]
MLRPALPRIANSLKLFHRSLHNVPILNHNFNNGVPGLLSPAGFDMAWTQYQALMVEKLNVLTAETDMESKSPKEILIKYARDPNSAPIFNYASMAHNNKFFFDGLSPNPGPMGNDLKKELESSFSSIETLRQEFILTATAMFGPGFVWLVKTKDRKYSILTTYLAGSPWPQAHYRRQPVDMNTENEQFSEHVRELQRGPAVNERKLGAHGRAAEVAPGGVELTPVLCLNTWEHVYLPDYGIGVGGAGGKRTYAENWWLAIDWDVVATYANPMSNSPAYL